MFIMCILLRNKGGGFGFVIFMVLEIIKGELRCRVGYIMFCFV